MKKILHFFLAILLITASIYISYAIFNKFYLTFFEHAIPPELLLKKPEKEIWLNIFVHGSFGTALGVLSLPKVVKDDVKGSWYNEMIKDMRKDPSFFAEQPILYKGLIKIEPTFNISAVGNKKLAAYPILKSFDEINKIIEPNQINLYYTFGWTGLMSQKRRRVESIRFYNELCEELEDFETRGITPKIRIIAHSHGGNLCLNLAAIKLIITKLSENPLPKWTASSPENESLAELYNLIKTLPSKESAKAKAKMKQFDYLSTNKNLKVQEFIMLGTPIQPETEAFCRYDLFEKIYNFYSIKDYIQQIDFVSTKQGYSSQRINPQIVQESQTIFQARIMVCRSMKKEKEQNQKTQPNTQQEEGLLSKVLTSAQTYLSDESKDPSHKDLWFATWGRENETFLTPIPVVVFVSLITRAIEKANHNNNDFDINIKQSKNQKQLKIQVSKYNEFVVKAEEIFPMKTIENLRLELKKWDPKEEEHDKNLASIFNNIKIKFKNQQLAKIEGAYRTV